MPESRNLSMALAVDEVKVPRCRVPLFISAIAKLPSDHAMATTPTPGPGDAKLASTNREWHGLIEGRFTQLRRYVRADTPAMWIGMMQLSKGQVNEATLRNTILRLIASMCREWGFDSFCAIELKGSYKRLVWDSNVRKQR